MSKIRVLITDDAVVIRKILTDTLSSDPDIEVVGTASNGRIALQKIQQLNPDIITLDIEMPELNGLDTIPLIRKDYPRLPIIMFSTLTERGGQATLEALARGASDYVTKPANVGNVTSSKETVKEDLIRKIKSLVLRGDKPAQMTASGSSSLLPTQSKIKLATPRIIKIAVKVVVIGVSTGGPNALAKLIPALPADFPVPILVVQHMPPMFTRLLAERLDSQSALKVVEATNDMRIESGTVYIAPGDFHLEARQIGTEIRTFLTQAEKENSCRPAVDVLFRSLSSLYSSGVLGVVLTGMGKDGVRGSELICAAGGSVIVQDQATSVVWGMPAYVAEAGLAEAILPLEQVAPEIARRVLLFRELNRASVEGVSNVKL